MTSALQDLLERFVAAGTIPGAVALLGSREPEIVAVGLSALDGGPMRPDAIMRIQSMTKAVTSVATLRLVEAGRLALDQPVKQWLPELSDPKVLTSPTAALDDTVPAVRDVTVRHLLTNTSGYGIQFGNAALQQAMVDNSTESGPEPPALGADEWIARLAELPLAFQPGDGWRYHHSFGLLGILISRVTDRPLGDHLADDLFAPLQMPDTAMWVPEEKLDRLPAAYGHGDQALIETEPAGGGFYAGPPPFDVSHAELVSTIADYARFAQLLVDRGRVDDEQLVTAEHVRQLTSDQVPAAAKMSDSFFPGFWDGTGWGFGVAIEIAGPHPGRYGWSGGQGTDFFVDPDGTIGILFTQVELGAELAPLMNDFHALRPDTA